MRGQGGIRAFSPDDVDRDNMAISVCRQVRVINRKLLSRRPSGTRSVKRQ